MRDDNDDDDIVAYKAYLSPQARPAAKCANPEYKEYLVCISAPGAATV